MKRVAVFCGSSDGAQKEYKEVAAELGKELAVRGITLVYGGASVGMMGTLADSVLHNGGEVIGVIPKLLEEREISHKLLSKLYVVETMHERKARMSELADGFIVLPGGPGTMEEFFEIFTWAQIGLHQKPCGLLNVKDYFNPLLDLLDHMIEQKFLHERFRSFAIIENKPEALLRELYQFEPLSIKTYSTSKVIN
ncbi:MULTISPECIES: LOG family protein [Bacillaceae]|uniref:Cytokinin riboside 5'-monophosphate phosphoribohydrolase n=1 Tax=Metabacillus malikii TaxID=1504265 RepID=A0ABT9ZN23_9BACI|nr:MULTISPECIES: TIGR00730 family Rossman fold protein [Bacillaceae]MDQ0233212.1 uncharacterized protein (TIGR00730 family) [Metabacillus malikii]